MQDEVKCNSDSPSECTDVLGLSGILVGRVNSGRFFIFAMKAQDHFPIVARLLGNIFKCRRYFGVLFCLPK